MKKKLREKLTKAGMIAFLALIVIGFTLPGILHGLDDGTTQVPLAEPRVCQTDADCALTCDGQAIPVLCAQNLCLQNSCEEQSFFSFNPEPIQATLDVEVAGKALDLAPRAVQGDRYVTFSNNNVQLFSSRLPMVVVLEKAQVGLYNGCVLVDNEQYCSVNMTVNGQEESLQERYIPQDGDVIRVVAEK